jgi:hypothetical protein
VRIGLMHLRDSRVAIAWSSVATRNFSAAAPDRA